MLYVVNVTQYLHYDNADDAICDHVDDSISIILLYVIQVCDTISKTKLYVI